MSALLVTFYSLLSLQAPANACAMDGVASDAGVRVLNCVQAGGSCLPAGLPCCSESYCVQNVCRSL